MVKAGLAASRAVPRIAHTKYANHTLDLSFVVKRSSEHGFELALD